MNVKIYGVSGLADYIDFLAEIDGTHLPASGSQNGEYHMASIASFNLEAVTRACAKHGYAVRTQA